MTTNPPVLLLDACVLYPAGLRNLMMWLAVHDLIRPKWSDQIHEEWMRNVLNDRPDLTRDQLERTRRLMDEHAGDCLVTGHARHVARLELPDEDDRHVLAAAIESEAEAIVTWNSSDFPEATVSEFGIGVLTPDELVQSLLEEDVQATIRAMAEHRGSLANPPAFPQRIRRHVGAPGPETECRTVRRSAGFPLNGSESSCTPAFQSSVSFTLIGAVEAPAMRRDRGGGMTDSDGLNDSLRYRGPC